MESSPLACGILSPIGKDRSTVPGSTWSREGSRCSRGPSHFAIDEGPALRDLQVARHYACLRTPHLFRRFNDRRW